MPVLHHSHREHTPICSAHETCFPWLQHVARFGGLADAKTVDGATRDVDSFLAPSSILLDPQTPFHLSHRSRNSSLRRVLNSFVHQSRSSPFFLILPSTRTCSDFSISSFLMKLQGLSLSCRNEDPPLDLHLSDCIQHSLSLESPTLLMLSFPLRSCLPFNDHQFPWFCGLFSLCFLSVRLSQCPISCPSSRLIVHRVGLHDDESSQSSLFTGTISAVLVNLATVPADTVVLAFAFILAFAHLRLLDNGKQFLLCNAAVTRIFVLTFQRVLCQVLRDIRCAR